ncbi:MAG: hypothetical protein ABID09_00320 [Candidatus Omnitrophota bacterium]
MAKKMVCKCGIKRKSGYLYFVGKDGCAYEVKMARGKKKGGGKKKIHDCRIKKEKGYLYFIEKKGNVSAAEMQRGGKKKKKKKKR